jgi:hypothetical protein
VSQTIKSARPLPFSRNADIIQDWKETPAKIERDFLVFCPALFSFLCNGRRILDQEVFRTLATVVGPRLNNARPDSCTAAKFTLIQSPRRRAAAGTKVNVSSFISLI